MIKEYLSTGGLTHIHTNLSKDGRYSVEQIGQYVGRFLKSEYFAIGDHLTSPYSDKTYPDDVIKPRVDNMLAEVAMYNSHNASPICVSGIEVNIKPSGLDIPPNYLRDIDLVIASRHFPWGQEGSREITKNTILAMECADVDVIGHIDRGTSGDIDWRIIIEAAAKTKTVIEINTDTPPPLDIMCLLSELQVPVTIGLDFHTFSGLYKQMGSDQLTEQNYHLPPAKYAVRNIMTILKSMRQAKIEIGQVVNLLSYRDLIKLLRTPKNERGF